MLAMLLNRMDRRQAGSYMAPSSRVPVMSKIMTAAEAVARIPDNANLATGGFVGIGFAEQIAIALEPVSYTHL